MWLALSAAVFGFFWLRHSEQRSQRRCAAMVMALVCVACLLFPVVSMTDDLNSSPALPEATKIKNLLALQLVIGLLSFVQLYTAPALLCMGSAFEQTHKRAQQQFLSFDLSRRPPPALHFA